MHDIHTPADVLFILLGAILILAMHAGFAFLELGTVRGKNQVNALVKILCDFAVSTLAYFLVGYGIAYGVHFFGPASALSRSHGYELTRFFFLLTFAAATPAIVSGGIAERVSIPSCSPPSWSSACSTRCSSIWPGTTAGGSRAGYNATSARPSTTSRAPSSCTPSAAG